MLHILYLLQLFSGASYNNMFRVFHMLDLFHPCFLGLMLQLFLCGRRMHLIRMFAYCCNGFQVCFRCVFQVFQKNVSNVSSAFR
jgi:hypothetical protein